MEYITGCSKGKTMAMGSLCCGRLSTNHSHLSLLSAKQKGDFEFPTLFIFNSKNVGVYD